MGPVRAGLLVSLLVTGAGAAGGLYGNHTGPLTPLELETVDARFRLRGASKVEEPLCIVAIDDESHRSMGERLQRRAGIAELVIALRAAGTKGIAIDAIFPDAERVLPAALVRDIDAWLARPRPADGPELSDAPTSASLADARLLLERTRAVARGDELLARAFAGDDVILALHAGVASGFEGLRADVEKAAYGQQVPGKSMPPAAHRLIASLPAFHDAAAALGVITVVTDRDGRTVRAVPLGSTVAERVLMPFGVAIAALALDVPRGRLAYDAAGRVLHIGERTFHADDQHHLTLNHRGDADSFCSVSAASVLDGKAGDALVGKVALVAYTALGTDTVRSPFSTQLSGAAVHATFASNLLRNDPLTVAPAPWGIAVALVLGLLSALVFSSRLRAGARMRVAVIVALAGAWGVVAHLLFVAALVVVPVVGPLLALVGASTSAVVVAYGAEGMQRLRLRRAFAHYLADDVIEEVLRNPRALALGGERRTLTVLFSDIRGFTTLSEELDPLALVRLLNTYFTPMTRAVIDSGGMLDKYIGDAVMAVFGAPVPRPHHGDDALACVLTMHARLRSLEESDAFGGRKIEIGVGLNTGEMVVGNMGSVERFNYTVAGDAVNLASRIEGLTRGYGVFCLVGDSTRRLAAPRFQFRDIDLVRVKGKRQPSGIHELLGDGAHSVARYADLSVWDEALAAYRAGRFADARAAFARFAAKNPHDVAAPLFLSRLDVLQEPPPGWDGVFEQTSK